MSNKNNTHIGTDHTYHKETKHKTLKIINFLLYLTLGPWLGNSIIYQQTETSTANSHSTTELREGVHNGRKGRKLCRFLALIWWKSLLKLIFKYHLPQTTDNTLQNHCRYLLITTHTTVVGSISNHCYNIVHGLQNLYQLSLMIGRHPCKHDALGDYCPHQGRQVSSQQ